MDLICLFTVRNLFYDSDNKAVIILFMDALRTRCEHSILPLWFYLSFFLFSSAIVHSWRLDVYHTSTHDVALLQI